MLKKTLIAAAMAVTAGLLLATPASAEPGDNPCEFAISYFCKFVPIAPDLDHDIDVTQQQQIDPDAPPPESRPAFDPCAAGCI
jgi:hypothetical protein